MIQDCGCCSIAKPAPVSNLPAHSSLEYRIGTYGSFREAMLTDISKGSLSSLLTRESDDYAITILELFAAVADVITFYQERYVQEFFLRTANRPESLSRLAAMLDYQLRPGVAARAQLAFTVAAGKRVVVPPGLRVQSVPTSDKKPQIYETLTPLTADSALNRLRIYPEPIAESPLAAGSRGGYLAPGPGAESAASHLKPGDRLLVFVPGGMASEELEVDQLIVEEDRFLISWKRPVQGWWGPDARVVKVARVFHVFGYNAPAQYMAVSSSSTGTATGKLVKKFTGATTTTSSGATTSIATAADNTAPSSSLSWSLITNDFVYPAQAQTIESLGALCLDTTYRGLDAGVEVVVSIGGKVYLTTASAVDQTRDSYGGLTGTVSRLSLQPPLDKSFDRSSAAVYELVGAPVEFWGYRYPEALTGSTAWVPVRRIDAATVEVGRTVVRNKYQPGTRLDIGLLSGGRNVLLGDGIGHSVHATVTEAVAAPASVSPTNSDADTAAALGLDERQARPVTLLVSGVLGTTIDQRSRGIPLMVTIGAKGPKPVVLVDLLGDLSAMAASVQSCINSADASPEFRDARVCVVGGNRFVLVPGGTTESAAFVDSGVTAEDLGWDPSQAFYVSALLSSPFSTVPAVTIGVEVSVTLGGVGPRRVMLGSGPADAQLQSGIRTADPAPAFTAAEVAVLSSSQDPSLAVLNLLLIPGPVIPGRQDFLRLNLAPETPPELNARSAVLLGNVIEGSHGETVRGEMLGSGDASARFQRFALKKKPVTYLAGASAAGARSTLELLVNGVLWNEVSSLFAEPSTAQVYTARLGEDGSTVLQFGDGDTGSLLPTGRNNVVATYRMGSGLVGRVGEGSLSTLLDRPTGLAAVTNPAPASGGADPEPPASIRRNVPRTVRTFGRAISLRDFEDLVMASGEVAKADAAWAWDGFTRIIHVTVAAQAAGSFAPEDLRRLAGNLASSRDRNHALRLDNFVPIPVVVQAVLVVDASRLHSDVLSAAQGALARALSFDALSLGQTVHLSDVYRVLQEVDGVSHVDVHQLRYKQPAGMSAQDFLAFLAARGAVLLSDGSGQDLIQPKLRVLGARPDLLHPGAVLAGELASVDAPGDLQVDAIGGITLS